MKWWRSRGSRRDEPAASWMAVGGIPGSEKFGTPRIVVEPGPVGARDESVVTRVVFVGTDGRVVAESVAERVWSETPDGFLVLRDEVSLRASRFSGVDHVAVEVPDFRGMRIVRPTPGLMAAEGDTLSLRAGGVRFKVGKG